MHSLQIKIRSAAHFLISCQPRGIYRRLEKINKSDNAGFIHNANPNRREDHQNDINLHKTQDLWSGQWSSSTTEMIAQSEANRAQNENPVTSFLTLNYSEINQSVCCILHTQMFNILCMRVCVCIKCPNIVKFGSIWGSQTLDTSSIHCRRSFQKHSGLIPNGLPLNT